MKNEKMKNKVLFYLIKKDFEEKKDHRKYPLWSS